MYLYTKAYLDKIETAINRLQEFPESGSIPGYSILKKQGYRVVIIERHLVSYKINEEDKAAACIDDIRWFFVCGNISTASVPELTVLNFPFSVLCWLVCEKMGIKNPSAEYLRGYLIKNDENAKEYTSFESIKRVDKTGSEFWYARELEPVLASKNSGHDTDE